MKLKLDENLGTQGAPALRQAGHDVATVYEQGLIGSEDHDLITLCREEERALVSLDLGSANPLEYDPLSFSGIAVLRLPRRPTPSDLDEAFGTLTRALADRPLQGKLWIVERARIREYRPENEELDLG